MIAVAAGAWVALKRRRAIGRRSIDNRKCVIRIGEHGDEPPHGHAVRTAGTVAAVNDWDFWMMSVTAEMMSLARASGSLLK